ncbi:MAG: molybdate ABC transporter substrate-binding protein [Chloroflexi bacterium]|nr:molybdate ABC transporter substrate-binding protein [Chloroflexota bacterium]|tara:strand:- start:98 stop:898 length:801 start_codon:yes stop_codon:yes gene_type:complete
METKLYINSIKKKLLFSAFYFLTSITIFLNLSCSNNANSITVLSAASMADVMDEIIIDFEKEQERNVHISYAGSQYLAQQLVIGSPGDIILSAGESPIEFLLERDIVKTETVNLLSNHLVLITRPDFLKRNISSLSVLSDNKIKYVAIADPRLAPAGVYAKESLTNLDLWSSLSDKMLTTPDVRSAMLAVSTGAAQAAIVYHTDAITLPSIEIFDIIPQESYKEIKYILAINNSSSNKTLANEFVSFLQTKSTEKIFRKHGFEMYK